MSRFGIESKTLKGNNNRKVGEIRMMWNKYTETRPDKAGDYIVLFDDGAGGNCVSADVVHYYMAGDIIGAGAPEAGKTAEGKLLDSILNRPVIAGNHGFYCSENDEGIGDKCWEVKPVFWAFLPDAPDGYTYL